MAERIGLVIHAESGLGILHRLTGVIADHQGDIAPPPPPPPPEGAALTVSVRLVLACWPVLSVMVSCTVTLPAAFVTSVADGPSVAPLSDATLLPLVTDHA